jgi:hypothetical protein
LIFHVYWGLPAPAGPEQWFRDHWFQLLQSLGIVGGLVFTGWNIRAANRARRLSTLLEIAKSHRDIWGKAFGNPSMQRVLAADRDLAFEPLSQDERVFATLMIIHLSCLFEARKSKSMLPLEHLEDDMRDFMSMPVPTSVWQQMKGYQNADFVAFVDAALMTSSRPTVALPHDPAAIELASS